MRGLLAALFLLAAAGAGAAGRAGDAGAADETTVKIVDYFLKTPPGEANPKLVEPFLAVDPDTLPKRQREKARAKQIEIRTLVKLHDTKKKGNWLMPVEGCTLDKFVRPRKDRTAYALAGFADIKEEELAYVMHKTKCTEEDLGCQFSLMIFWDKDKPKTPRLLMLSPSDPIMALVAESHATNGAGGQTNFFGIGLTCQH